MQKRYFAAALLRVSGMGQKPKFIGVTSSCQGRRPEEFALEYFDDLYYIAGSETQQAAVRGASSRQWQDRCADETGAQGDENGEEESREEKAPIVVSFPK